MAARYWRASAPIWANAIANIHDEESYFSNLFLHSDGRWANFLVGARRANADNCSTGCERH